MTLTRRMALFIATVLLLALGGAWVIHTVAAHRAMLLQQDMRNRDAAAALALALSQQGGDPVALQAVATAQFDLGHYRSIALTAPDGQAIISLERATTDAPRAPAWFVALLPLQVAPGTALVSSGWTELGRLKVVAQTQWAHEALWQASAQTAGLLAVLAALAAALATWLLRAWQRPLQATIAQAQALEQGRFVVADLPALPELRALTRSMNAMVKRLHDMLAGQAEQVAYLQRRAQLDPLTGLPLRHQLMPALTRRLAHHGGLGLPLVLVRVAQLEQLNQHLGHAGADGLLRQLALVLKRRVQQEPGTLVGRLGGGDFLLCWPVAGMAADTAPALMRALREAAAHAAPQWPVMLQVAAIEGATGQDADQALAAAYPALDSADLTTGLFVQPLRAATHALSNREAWHAQITQALANQRVRLGEFAVLNAQGQLIHLECPLRLQLDPHGEYLPAARWLAMARRCGLMAQVDQAAIGQALKACAADGRPRAVNLALSSLAAPGLVAWVAEQLKAAPEAARCLSIEWVDGGNPADWQAAEAAIAAWHGHGVRMGVEHAGAAPELLARLRDLGLDYVKVDGMHLRGAAIDQAVNAYARSLVGLIQLLGLKALAEGVENADDLTALWQLGFDGATGGALDEGARRSSVTPMPAQGLPLPLPPEHSAV